jgi:hypothetical protein
LFEEDGELALYSIGKSQGGGLLGLGENQHEAKWFEKLELRVVKDGEKEATPVKISTVEGVDIRCGRAHTLIGINNCEHIFALGCYDRRQAQHEEVLFSPAPLKVTSSYNVSKFSTDTTLTCIVATKKSTNKLCILSG